MGISAYVGKHRKLAAVASVGVVGLAVFVVLWFQPQKLFFSKTVDEAIPLAIPTATASATTRPPAGEAATAIASGAFRSLEHRTTGSVRLLQLFDGSHVLRLENLDTSNGPDVRVYLSRVTSDHGQRAYGHDFIDLGALKGNRGNQNYSVPAGVDISAFKSAVIWCRRFTVGFAVAPLQAA